MTSKMLYDKVSGNIIGLAYTFQDINIFENKKNKDHYENTDLGSTIY